MKGAAIQIQNATVVLGGGFTALHAVHMELAAGKITGFIGPSGAGKTTLIRAIVGRQRLKAGSITVFGKPAGAPALRSQMRYMTQEVSVYDDLTVTENVRYFARMLEVSAVTKQQREAMIGDVLQTVGLTDKAHSLVEDLSGGQKQRASLAVALLGEPQLLVLDEPTVGLDPVLREQLWQLFRQLASSGVTLIISSHVMDEAERCDDLVLLREGRIIAHDTPQVLCRKTGVKTVEQSFLKLVETAV